jgi:hypothetical protein
MSDDTDNKKLYRVDWKYVDLDKGVDEDYAYIGANTPLDATTGIPGTDFIIREATQEEMEAYVAGYEDGYDIAIISTRLEDLDAGIELDIEELD